MGERGIGNSQLARNLLRWFVAQLVFPSHALDNKEGLGVRQSRAACHA
jgi:hypothetical protein